MPIIDNNWVPPSTLITQMGLAAYTAQYEAVAKKTGQKKVQEEVDEMPTTPLDAREGFLFGCDPEGFIFKGDTPVTAEGLIPGTKADPHPIEVKGEIVGYSQVDGMAAEFNIPPAKTFRDFNRYVNVTIKEIEKMLPEGHSLRFVPSVTFDAAIFDAAPDCAKELGCSPDFDAWTGAVNPPPHDIENPYLRTASGHLHIGWTEDACSIDPQHIMNCRDLVKQLDWYLGGWSVKFDNDPTRRRLYGRAGAYRLKPYGVEYRVLSNFWVTSRERRMAVWNRMQHAINSMAKGFLPEKVKHSINAALVESINVCTLSPYLTERYHYPLMSLQPWGF